MSLRGQSPKQSPIKQTWLIKENHVSEEIASLGKAPSSQRHVFYFYSVNHKIPPNPHKNASKITRMTQNHLMKPGVPRSSNASDGF